MSAAAVIASYLSTSKVEKKSEYTPTTANNNNLPLELAIINVWIFVIPIFFSKRHFLLALFTFDKSAVLKQPKHSYHLSY